MFLLNVVISFNYILVIGSGFPTEQLVDAENTSLVETSSTPEFSDLGPSLPFIDDDNVHLDKRTNRLDDRWYTHSYVRNHLRTWWFHNSTSFFNITIPEIVCDHDMIGSWEFMNGSLKYDATWGDIRNDLAIGQHTLTQEERSSAVTKNALLAQSDALQYLEDYVLCPSDRTISADFGGRHLLWVSEGRVTALLLQTVGGFLFGLLVGQLQNDWAATKQQLYGTGLALGGAMLLSGIISISRDNGAWIGFEGELSP